MKILRLILPTLVLCVSLAGSQEPQRLTPAQERALRVRYPQRWELRIPAGTRLDSIRRIHDTRLQYLPADDIKDRSPFPLWFRAYLRQLHPGLPTTGLYQYPRVAAQILEWMMAHPDLNVPPPSRPGQRSMMIGPSRVAVVGTNINVTNFNERNSESFIAVDYSDPKFLVAASNNISGSGRQKQFFSADSGVTWSSTELPLAPGSAFHSDPAVGWTTDGTAWATTLGINNSGSAIAVQVYKSTDHGANWKLVATVSTGNNNDKELMCIDAEPGSPNKNNIYVVWDVPGNGMRFVRSTDKGGTWSSIAVLSTDQAIGSHVATGPGGEVYVGWPDVNSRELRIRKSVDGGATFGPTHVIATTNDAFEVSIPAMCERKALIYISLGVDRSAGPRRGWVYAVWADRNGTDPDPGCTDTASMSNANVYISRSTNGGNTWSAPAIVHSNPDRTDQFNPWMDVDPTDGTIHVAFYDTRDDPGRKKTHLYYAASGDGGSTWVDETRVTTEQTDETASDADLGNQYGDYNGLVAYRGAAHPVWTDRRSGVPGNMEQIFTARVSKGDSTPAVPLTIVVTLDSNTKLKNGQTTTVRAVVTAGGTAQPGRTVTFTTGDPNILSVTPSSAITNGAGEATATVTCVTSQSATTSVTAQAENITASAPVQVPEVSVAAAIAVALYMAFVEYRRRRSCMRRV